MYPQPSTENSPASKPRQRSVRRPFRPSPPAGPYRLPREVDDRLVPALRGFRNRAEAYRLATFLPRYWATPGRLTMAFPIAREALCLRRTDAALAKAAEKVIAKELGLTEKRIRTAITTLVAVDYIDPVKAKGNGRKSRCQMAALKYHFGPDYAPLFAAANRRAKAARARQEARRRAIEARPLPIAPANAAASYGLAKGPGETTAQADRVSPGPLRTEGARPPLRGELVRKEGPAVAGRRAAEGRSASIAPNLARPASPASDPRLEAAIARLGRAFRN